MSETIVNVRSRVPGQKGANRRLRASGEIPAVVYGAGLDPVAIGVQGDVVYRLLKASGENAVFKLQLEGTDQSRHAMIRDIQYDPRNGKLVHLDFVRLVMDQEVTVSVPIHLEGTPEGVKTEGGLLDFVTREISVTCLPSAIPQQLELDVSELHIGQHVEAGALELPDGVSLVEEPDRVLVSVSVAKMQEEEVDEETEEEELLEAAAAEPEVVGAEADSDS